LAYIVRSFHTRIKILNLQRNSDRNKTGSRRFKPNSCAILIDEQSNPKYVLQHLDIASRHRGDKHRRRYERLVYIILLSLQYLLFDNQIVCHSKNLVH